MTTNTEQQERDTPVGDAVSAEQLEPKATPDPFTMGGVSSLGSVIGGLGTSSDAICVATEGSDE